MEDHSSSTAPYQKLRDNNNNNNSFSFLGCLKFRKRRQQHGKVTYRDDKKLEAMHTKIKETQIILTLKIRKLNYQIEKLMLDARKELENPQGTKDIANLKLRKKVRLEADKQKKLRVSDNLEQLLETLESLTDLQDIKEVMGQADKILQNALANLEIKDIDNLIINLQEHTDKTIDINNALGDEEMFFHSVEVDAEMAELQSEIEHEKYGYNNNNNNNNDVALDDDAESETVEEEKQQLKKSRNNNKNNKKKIPEMI